MSPKVSNQPDAQEHLSILKQQLQGYEGIELTDSFPDIVHVFGAWDTQTNKKIDRCHRLLIPTVLSTLGKLAPWYLEYYKVPAQLLQRSAQKMSAQHATALIVWGEKEKQEMEKRKWNRHIRMIHNALTTSLISPQDMANETVKLYHEAIAYHDKMICEHIEKKLTVFPEEKNSEKTVCRQLLYLRYQFHRHNIKRHSLKTLNDTLNTAEYDEDILNGMLKQLHEDRFAARMMQVLSEEYHLTEGFMPLDSLDDKATKKIREAMNPQTTI